jgi:hypothetical protein
MTIPSSQLTTPRATRTRVDTVLAALVDACLRSRNAQSEHVCLRATPSQSLPTCLVQIGSCPLLLFFSLCGLKPDD